MTTISKTKRSYTINEWLGENWAKLFLAIYGFWVILPFFAPLFMRIGWTDLAKGIYRLYSFFCHQLPQRSLFLFGQKTMYSLAEIQSVWQNTFDPFVLREFVGNTEFGYKIAWSDRMISFYGGIWLFGLHWLSLRKRIKQIPWWGFLLLLTPIMVDGSSHLVSDLAGIRQGVRDTNMWLINLTDNTFPVSFYAGDAIGSFNSWMRWITGLLAGLGLVWFILPTVDTAFGVVKLARKL